MHILWAWTYAFIASLSSCLFGYNLMMTLELAKNPLYQLRIQNIDKNDSITLNYATSCRNYMVALGCSTILNQTVVRTEKCTKVGNFSISIIDGTVTQFSDLSCSRKLGTTMISDCVSFGANKLQIQPFGCTNGPPQSIDDFIRFGILLFLVGSLVGAMMMGTIADSIGRKRSFFIGSFLAVIAGVGQTFTTSVSWFYGYQFLMGSFAGFLSVLGAVYLTEIVKPDGRGGLVSWLYIMLCEGISVSFFVQSTVLPPHRGTVMEYQLTIATQSVISGIILVSAFLLEESPRWLALRGHSQRGLFAHAKLMGYSKQEVDPEVCERYQEIQKSCSGQMMETTPNFVELFSKEYVQVTSLCIKVALMQAFTGAPLFAFFMLRQVPFLTQFQNGIYLNFANVGAVCLGMVLIDKLGRRPIVVIGSVLMAISYAFVMIDQIPRTFSVFFYVICFSGTWGHLPWTYLPEVLPARIRAQAFGLATAVGWTVFMILFILAPTLFDMFDRWVFLGTGSLCLLIAVYSHFVVQETKQLHLEEITLSFPKMK